MFRVELGDASRFKALASLNDIGYFDVIISEKNATFISNSKAIYGELILPSSSSIPGISPIVCRISVKLMVGMIGTDYCIINEEDDFIIMSFYDSLDRRICKSTFEKQATDMESYMYKLDLLKTNPPMSEPLNVESLMEFVRIGKESLSVIAVDGDLAYINIPDNGRLFKKIKSNIKFTLNSDALLKVLHVDGNIRVFQNYVYASSGTMKVMCLMSRTMDTIDYYTAQSQEVFFSCYIDFSNILNFTSKFNSKNSELVVELDTSEFNLRDDHISYTVDVNIASARHELRSAIKRIKIPYGILDKVIRKFKSNTYFLKACKEIVILERDDITIVFGRQKTPKIEAKPVFNFD